MIDFLPVRIKPYREAQALIALHTASKAQGISFLASEAHPLSEEAAYEALVAGNFYVDYCAGRVIKTNFKTPDLKLRLYDRDNGGGAGLKALKEAGLLAGPDLSDCPVCDAVAYFYTTRKESYGYWPEAIGVHCLGCGHNRGCEDTEKWVKGKGHISCGDEARTKAAEKWNWRGDGKHTT